jgi:hypothetical protein
MDGCPTGSAPDDNHICQPTPYENKNEKICFTAECAADLPPAPDKSCCDYKKIYECLSDLVPDSTDCAICALSKGKEKTACTSCKATALKAAACFTKFCGTSQCSNCGK